MTTNQEGGLLETLRNLGSYILAGIVWLVSLIPLTCHLLYDAMVIGAQILAFVLVLCKVIEALPTAIRIVKGWLKKRGAREDP